MMHNNDNSAYISHLHASQEPLIFFIIIIIKSYF
jgi:hypothetical protein